MPEPAGKVGFRNMVLRRSGNRKLNGINVQCSGLYLIKRAKRPENLDLIWPGGLFGMRFITGMCEKSQSHGGCDTPSSGLLGPPQLRWGGARLLGLFEYRLDVIEWPNNLLELQLLWLRVPFTCCCFNGCRLRQRDVPVRRAEKEIINSKVVA